MKACRRRGLPVFKHRRWLLLAARAQNQLKLSSKLSTGCAVKKEIDAVIDVHQEFDHGPSKVQLRDVLLLEAVGHERRHYGEGVHG